LNGRKKLRELIEEERKCGFELARKAVEK
jgi:hypothetical protein